MSQIRILAAFCIALLINVPSFADVHPTIIKNESPTLELDIQYPQGFSQPSANELINQFIINEKKAVEKDNEADKTSIDVPGKNSLVTRFKIYVNKPNLVSAMISISKNYRGAAHPMHSVKTFNILNGKPLSLLNVLGSEANLNELADYCRKLLLDKNLADAKWTAEGTAPTTDNYSNWYFTADALVIVFDTYQVAPYAAGVQKITIPKELAKKWITPQLAQQVWGNQ